MRPDEHLRRRAAKIVDGCFAAVIRGFMNSPKFQGYAEGTRELWALQFRLAEQILGPISIYELRPSLVQALLDGLADRPGKQSCMLSALKQVEKWGIVRDLLPHTITLGCEAKGSQGGHVPWTDVQVEMGERFARPFLGRVITLAANAGQRGSDLVRMRWTDIDVYDGRPGIKVIQQKTKKEIWVPFTETLIEAIATWERRPGFILLKANGQPWTRKQLTGAWIYELENNAALAPLAEAGLVLHGLRATACVRLSRAGATTRQISDMVGMSEEMVARYCRFSVQRDNASAAVLHLDRTAREQARSKLSRNGS